ncbi:hypothetical protein SLE2022_367420 [Rubroshorea leprosula]
MLQFTCTKLVLFTVAGVIVQIIGLSLFVFGFFPVKPSLSGASGPESFYEPICDIVENRNVTTLHPEQLKHLYQELSGIPPSFDRLILMVIDGLPAEFILGKDGQPPSKKFTEAMPYTQSLLASGLAIGYHAKAAPPTVTMPRLKAMVSGAIGGFLDVAFNFNTQALLDDNILEQFFRIGRKMVMLGDETWLKLFPGLFTRHDGVSSFFVKDTVQVDQNVSRHLGYELSKDDWNLLILHYLGVDHVGHIGGRSSVLMPSKLIEMDEVVKMIYSRTMETQENNQQRTLLMVVSDHGMTENGNHGGSSYEETDSLVLVIGLRNHASDYASAIQNTAYQVDIAPTLALLFGVPIPKNNVGVLISEAFDALKDDQQLRALELNSWQLLRLLQEELPGLPCQKFPCDGFSNHQGSCTNECDHSIERKLCSLYKNAAELHSSWKSKKGSQSSSGKDYSYTVAAYYKFLKSASEWLSRRTTEKPVSLLTVGVATMFISCMMLLSLIFGLVRDVYLPANRQMSNSTDSTERWSLVDEFVLGVILILIISMGSSSMVEEEHYIWHFVLSTYYLLLLRKSAQSLTTIGMQNSFSLFKGEKGKNYLWLPFVIMLLISGRILRGWHQGGVNWTSLPDISKWLEQSGSDLVKLVQLISAILVISLGLFALLLVGSMGKLFMMVKFSFLISGLLVLLHILKYQDDTLASSNFGATFLAQTIYAILGTATLGTVVALPWVIPLTISKMSSNLKILSPSSVSVGIQDNFPVAELRDTLYMSGWAYVIFWCLLQLLLQQPINSTPILLLLLQILASILYYSSDGMCYKELVEVAALYYLGMAGHFALGNSNTLATIDVAGAFIGISSHSTLLSGILMFIITYASPMFVLLSLLLYISMKTTSYLVIPEKADSGNLLIKLLGLPCLVPLGLNSILMTAYTVVLLLMRNHLFVWSVFSPKYLYVCATTVCNYIGVSIVASTGIYTYLVLTIRQRRQVAIINKQR